MNFLKANWRFSESALADLPRVITGSRSIRGWTGFIWELSCCALPRPGGSCTWWIAFRRLPVTAIYLIGGILAVLLFVYLLFALLKPEWFS
jgi:K+-transporting ATPase KdpF subunit